MNALKWAIFCSVVTLALSQLSTLTKGDPAVGTLFTMDNSATANHVVAFQRGHDGQLTGPAMFDTGGTGTGTALSSQGAVQLSRDGRWLFVANAGSSEVSVFAVSEGGLTLADKVASGGQTPVSLALRRNLLYVLNAGGLIGGQDNITGFVLTGGKLQAVPDSTRTLSADSTGPAQVSFTEEGDVLVVTERLTSLIDTFAVGDDGVPTNLNTFESVGSVPFGFGIGRDNRVFVSEAAASTISSYDVSDQGSLMVISGSVPTHQSAACWAMTSRDGRVVYTANAASGSISGFAIADDGSLQLITANGQTGLTGPGSHPTDMAQSIDGRFLYSLNNGNGTISAFDVQNDGSLRPLPQTSGLPTSSTGLTGR